MDKLLACILTYMLATSSETLGVYNYMLAVHYILAVHGQPMIQKTHYSSVLVEYSLHEYEAKP